MNKTRKKVEKQNKINKSIKGGEAIASGGFGCVFSPALKCEGENKRDENKISKLMINKYAIKEFEEINNIKHNLISIPNYEHYFLLNNITLCKPAKLSETDLKNFKNKCSALPKNKITKSNINSKLNDVTALNIPYGGVPIDDFIYNDFSYDKFYIIHKQLVKLLINGIIPMNSKGVFHCDLKDSNILIDEMLNSKIIDWGLSVKYISNKNNTIQQFPKNWRNRPLQFNVPFSVIIFTDLFYEKYSDYLKKNGEITEYELKPFVIEYLKEWMKERGNGHYKFINEIMYILFEHNFENISLKNRPSIIETEITIPTIINYIVDVLNNYTLFRKDETLNLREYLNKVFIYNIDIWGFIHIYFPIIEILYSQYNKLSVNEKELFVNLKYLFCEIAYKNGNKIIDKNNLLKNLDNIEQILKTLKTETTKIKSNKLSSVLSLKMRKKSTTKKSLFRKLLKKSLKSKLKNSYLLSLK